jgi:hypothetical protein
MTFKVGDLAPGRIYNVFKASDNIARLTADDRGFIAFQDTAVGTGSKDYVVRP